MKIPAQSEKVIREMCPKLNQTKSKKYFLQFLKSKSHPKLTEHITVSKKLGFILTQTPIY